MNANDQFFARDAKVDSAAVAPLPASRKIYVEGSRANVRVPMREISQSDTPASFGAEKNPPLAVYDTSGPYTDPSAVIDIRKGLAPLRPRGSPKGRHGRLAGPTSPSARRGCRFRARGPALRPAPRRAARRPARTSRNALRAPRHRHAGDGVHRNPGKPVARELITRCPKACAASIRARASAPRSRT